MISSAKIDPSDTGLPMSAIRKRRRSRRVARLMITVAVLSGIIGWVLYASSVSSALRLREQSPALALVAYGLLIVSSVTLVLGLWYFLIAQVERLARIVDAEEIDDPARGDHRCANCGWNFDSPDRFCRHCGHTLHPTDTRPLTPP